MGFLAIINGEFCFVLSAMSWMTQQFPFRSAYTMRSVLNISITEMVYRKGRPRDENDETCDFPGLGDITEREGFDWSQQLQGVILGAFFWGYVSEFECCLHSF